VAEVEDLVEFLAQRDDRQLTHAAARLAEKAFSFRGEARAHHDREAARPQ
jgi:hypothetical protein